MKFFITFMLLLGFLSDFFNRVEEALKTTTKGALKRQVIYFLIEAGLWVTAIVGLWRL